MYDQLPSDASTEEIEHSESRLPSTNESQKTLQKNDASEDHVVKLYTAILPPEDFMEKMQDNSLVCKNVDDEDVGDDDEDTKTMKINMELSKKFKNKKRKLKKKRSKAEKQKTLPSQEFMYNASNDSSDKRI